MRAECSSGLNQIEFLVLDSKINCLKLVSFDMEKFRHLN